VNQCSSDVIGTVNLTLEAVEHAAPSHGIDLTAIGQFCVIRVEDSIRFDPVFTPHQLCICFSNSHHGLHIGTAAHVRMHRRQAEKG